MILSFGNYGIRDIAYNNGRFVAVGMGGRIAYSSNGIVWTEVINSTFSNNFINNIIYGNGRWVVVDFDGRMAFSDVDQNGNNRW